MAAAEESGATKSVVNAGVFLYNLFRIGSPFL